MTMMPYNTNLPPLRLHEYGRNVMKMIDYCVSIPDREERNVCAYSIAAIMANLFPEIANPADNNRLIWDRMMAMSGYRLDVDFPCEVATSDQQTTKPERVEYVGGPIRHRMYGRHIESMIRAIVDMENSPEKDAMVSMVAHHMKKLMLTHNREGVDDARILRDLYEYSGGAIDLDPATYHLRDFVEVPEPAPQPKKKKKKK